MPVVLPLPLALLFSIFGRPVVILSHSFTLPSRSLISHPVLETDRKSNVKHPFGHSSTSPFPLIYHRLRCANHKPAKRAAISHRIANSKGTPPHRFFVRVCARRTSQLNFQGLDRRVRRGCRVAVLPWHSVAARPANRKTIYAPRQTCDANLVPSLKCRTPKSHLKGPSSRLRR